MTAKQRWQRAMDAAAIRFMQRPAGTDFFDAIGRLAFEEEDIDARYEAERSAQRQAYPRKWRKR